MINEFAVRDIVGRCYVSASNRTVIRYFVSRLKHGYTTWKEMPARKRHAYLKLIIAEHARNRKLYHQVMFHA